MSKRVILFLLTNLAITFVLGIVLNIIFQVTGIKGTSTTGILMMSLLFGFTGSLISLFMSKSMALRSVGAEVIQQPRNQAEQWLFNTVQRQSQKAGIPMPDIAIYHSADVNAFATGATKNNSLVAVSTGLLDNMTEDEAEAVVAHEIAHIANGDMVTMTLLQGVLNTFVIFLSRMISTAVSGSRDENGNSTQNTLVFWVVDIALQMIFGILATMIAMWFSRYREYRADMGSAQLVGKEKMIAALERLRHVHEPQEMQGSLSAFMINGIRSKELFMSHPPLEKRIEALRNL
ncbi:zinc metalloprotease HtpX [[Haemophilus] ducreyi]|uniref:Protease HtpX n=2 Tax=Haemophilus ducreyi TaxID=730 RepID=HTPX_HAEDU|nr:protease HtpX [[Haemophilus] ducreyi]Q7VNX2.1 RecName: Full=Protease HtpX; AltName: Full=Heat shock protein HtpX [[Haemophilus] ducreyi 35000HP]AAP95325.1 putative protease [[Haemophilus] ducreyi 35000HP]AKO30449.1 heat shock protein HtpX [[Haemophilus] ducreyi]AKO31884.1 heat shock protein HtpX [[Haemophilus] ducreyi]AKO33338.1 heat shock protein HtpX [[Haemophilus] ducreyi]AKO34786.1 heat shock protein HtpX [[Haemophilus] ducreyi]